MKFDQGEKSAVIHRTESYKHATCHNLWPCDFTDVTAFSSLFFLALHYCFFLYIFYLLWLFLWLYFYFFAILIFLGCDVLFQGHLSLLTAAFSGCFFGLFCPVLLGGYLLALVSSDWFFIWHSLRPSTQLLVHNHSGLCSHWYLAGLLFSSEYFFLQIVLQSSTLLSTWCRVSMKMCDSSRGDLTGVADRT